MSMFEAITLYYFLLLLYDFMFINVCLRVRVCVVALKNYVCVCKYAGVCACYILFMHFSE